jgi:hypothetical protein
MALSMMGNETWRDRLIPRPKGCPVGTRDGDVTKCINLDRSVIEDDGCNDWDDMRIAGRQ